LYFPTTTVRTISTGFSLLFLYMDTRYIHSHPHSSFPYAHPPPTSTHPQKDLFFPPALLFHLRRTILIVQGGFTLALQVCIYIVLLSINPHHYLLVLCHHAPSPVASAQGSISYLCIDGCLSSFHSLTFSLPLPPEGGLFSEHNIMEEKTTN
jgi:hypothetical protein